MTWSRGLILQYQFIYIGGTGNPITVFKRKKEMTHDLSHLSDVCFYCKRSYGLHKSVWRRKYAALRKTKDHVLPKSRGGFNGTDNYVSCCEDCNHLKSNMKPNEFAKWLKKELRQKNNSHPMFPMFKYIMFNSWKLYNKKQKLFKK